MAPTLRAQVAPSRATTPATARLPAPTKMMAPPPAPARRSPTSPASRPSVAASAATPWNPMPPAGTVLASAYGSVPPAEPSGRRAGEEGHEGMRGHDHTHAARAAHLFLCLCVLTDARLLPLFYVYAGVILHPTSLPGPPGMGDIGVATVTPFLDWCAGAGIAAWQVLPLVPPETAHWSPYSGEDALCGWPSLLSLRDLAADGLLSLGAVEGAEARWAVGGGGGGGARVDHAGVVAHRAPLLAAAADALLSRPPSDPLRSALDAWTRAHAWVADSALFHCLASEEAGCVGRAWWDWPPHLRDREPGALAAAAQGHARLAARFTALQFLFDRQWGAVQGAAKARGVQIIGDMPIYVGGHSADVWAHRGLFALDPATGAPSSVSGVPPDAFSETGQLWGSPLYDWPSHDAEGFAWWARRVGRAGELYDVTRIDHFRGLAGYWAVDAGAATAMGGAWVAGPGATFFDGLERAFRAAGAPVPALIAEDLGVITPDVASLRTASARAPGMAVLQFAWGGPRDGSNPHLPHNHEGRQVVYTGTHDNETSAGWVARGGAGPAEVEWMRTYWGLPAPRRRLLGLLPASKRADPLLSDPAGAFVRAAWGSVAATAVAPMQDFLRAGNEARMNTPGTAGGGNWGWRMGGGGGAWAELAGTAAELRALAAATGRLVPEQEAWVGDRGRA